MIVKTFKELGLEYRKVRESLGLLQAEVSRMAGLSANSTHRFENAFYDAKGVSLDTTLKLLDAIGLEMVVRRKRDVKE